MTQRKNPEIKDEFKEPAVKKRDFSLLNELHCSHHCKAKPDLDLKPSPYLFCNEQQQDETCIALIEHFKKGHSSRLPIHIGFSLAFNLDVLSLPGSPEVAIILDYDPSINVIFKHIEAILQNENFDTPQKFIDELVAKLDKDELLFLPRKDTVEKFQLLLARKFGFLSSQESFQRVKHKYLAGNIFFGYGDAADPILMQKIIDWCKKMEVDVTSTYLSNIPEWRRNQKKDPLTVIKILSPIMHQNTRIIDAFYPTKEQTGSGPPQRVFTIGNIPTYSRQQSQADKIMTDFYKQKRGIKRKTVCDNSLELNLEDEDLTGESKTKEDKNEELKSSKMPRKS